MSKIFFTSDHHFGHENIIRFCNRPFENAKQMNEVLIQKWNEKIGSKDNVYHLGDFGLNSKEELSDIIDQLNGQIHLIVGNHEGAALQNKKKFIWVKEYYELKVKDPNLKNGVQRIMLFHYAMRTWRGAGRGNWHLYGHSHGNLPDLEDSLSFDIGVDSHDFYPLSYEEVKALMQKKTWTPPFSNEDRKKMSSNKAFDVLEAYLCKKTIMKIVSQEILREIYRQPSGRATKKSMPSLDFHAKNFVSKSPFLILSSCNKKGEMDTSPRGGAAGFVKIIRDNQIVIPDAKGNNRLDSLSNIVETGRVSSLFLLPGIDETLRLNGSAYLSTDEQLLNLFKHEKNIPASCIVIEVEEVFLHCAKALMRSKLWSAESQIDPNEFPTMGQMLKDQLKSPDVAESREDMIKRYTPDL